MLNKWRIAAALAAAIGVGTLGYMAATTAPAGAQAAMSPETVPCTSAGMQAAIANFKSRLNGVSMSGNPDQDYMHVEMIISNANERVHEYGAKCAKDPKVKAMAKSHVGATKKEQQDLQNVINAGGGG